MQTAQSILIVDSEADGRSHLRQTLAGLRGVFPHHVVGEADCARSALSQIGSLRPSVLLVDPVLPDMNGIELGRRLVESRTPASASGGPGDHAQPQLIYVSGSDRHALDAFEVRALDYLLKPVDPARLLRALSRASAEGARPAQSGEGGAPSPSGSRDAGTQSASAQHGNASPSSPLLSGPAPSPLLPAPGSGAAAIAPSGPYPTSALPAPQRPTARRHFAVHERGRLMLVPVDQVIYLKAELKYVTVRTRQREYLIEDSLTALEGEFGDRFVRIHRNALVCRAAIAGFERVPPDAPGSGSEPHWQVVLRDVAERLPVSRRQWSTVRNLMG